MFEQGSHDRHTDQHQASRRRLRKGMAKVALQEQVTGKPKCDAYGRPLQYAHEMAQRHSIRTVERWSKGWSAGVVFKPSLRWCGVCKSAGKDPWQELDHEHRR